MPLQETYGRLSVERWMSTNVHTAEPAGSLMNAFDIMRDYRVRHVPIVEGEKLVGIVSDRDVRAALPSASQLRQGNTMTRTLMTRQLGEIMTSMPVTVTADDSIRTAAEIMCREKIGALPVVNDGRLVGIITAEDLLWALVELI